MRVSRRVLSMSLSAATLAWLAACNAPLKETAPVVLDDPTSTSGNASQVGIDASSGRREHLMANSSGLASAAARAGSSGTGISYHGGPVLTTGINVVAIYWASAPIYTGGPTAGTFSTTDNSADASLIGHFLRNIGGSPYYNINSTYTDQAGTKLANKVTYTGYWANNSSVPANGQSVSDATMQAMLQSGFTNGTLVYDPNTLYLIFTAGTVNLGGGFGSQYCGYHTNTNVVVGGVTKNILYSAMPYDWAYPSGCSAFASTNSPNGDKAADTEVSVLVHEIEETHTDALGNAWFDTRGYENADKCAWNFGTTLTASNGGKYNITIGGKNYLVQQNWVNAGTGGCRLSY